MASKIKLVRSEDGCGSDSHIMYSNETLGVRITKYSSWDKGTVLDSWLGKQNNKTESGWEITLFCDMWELEKTVQTFSKLNDAKKFLNANASEILTSINWKQEKINHWQDLINSTTEAMATPYYADKQEFMNKKIVSFTKHLSEAKEL